MSVAKTENLIQFACPKCKKIIQSDENGLFCKECDCVYPVIKNIPDFTSENLKANPIYRSIKKMEFLAPIYEGHLWHSFILKGVGAKKSSLVSIVDFVLKTFNGITGIFLDAACGPATYGRRVASSDRQVYGIDFSMGTLKQGMKNIARDGVTNIKLSRASVEELPFENNVFDGVICNGSLHLFPNTLHALQEISRTMKKGAVLAVTTFIDGDAPLIRRIKKQKKKLARVFEMSELHEYLKTADFEDFQSKIDGFFLLFTVRKTNNI